MTQIDYGDGYEIVKGGEEVFTVALTDSSGWPEGSDSWTWKMLIATRAAPHTLKLGITATSSTITTDTDEDDTMTLVFEMSATNSDTLTAGLYHVEIEAADADTHEHYKAPAAGTMVVRNPWAGG